MAPDDAADLVAELDEPRREAVLMLLPASQRTKVRALLGYDPAEAGGLMSPDFVSVYQQATVERGAPASAAATLGAGGAALTTMFVMDSLKRLEGSDPRRSTCCAPSRTPAWWSWCTGHAYDCAEEADFEEVARLMADYNLTAAPGRRLRASG